MLLLACWATVQLYKSVLTLNRSRNHNSKLRSGDVMGENGSIERSGSIRPSSIGSGCGASSAKRMKGLCAPKNGSTFGTSQNVPKSCVSLSVPNRESPIFVVESALRKRSVASSAKAMVAKEMAASNALPIASRCVERFNKFKITKNNIIIFLLFYTVVA